MFCSYCGKQIPDDAAFCAHCGRQLKAAEPQAAEPVAKKAGSFTAVPTVPRTQYGSQPIYNTPASGAVNQASPSELNEKKIQIFTREWKTFAASPLVLITLILFSVSQLFTIVSTLDSETSVLNDILRYLDDGIATILNLVTYGGIILNVLLVVGMWMVYVDAVAYPRFKPSSSGLRLINVTINITYIISILEILFMFILFVSEEYMMRRAFGVSSDQSGIFLFLLLIIGAVLILIYWMIVSITRNAISNVESCDTEYSKLSGMGVFIIVLGSISALAILFAFTLETVLSASSMIMIGCVMVSCKSTLAQIEGQYYRLRSSTKGSSASGYNSYRG